jgi:hypothetical protein
VAILFLGFLLYDYLINRLLVDRKYVSAIIALWLLSAYIVLPRLHRFFTRLYLPDYYIGRTRTSEGLLGDPVNIAFLGSKEAIMKNMKKAGWVEAEELNLQSTYKMIKASLLRKSYLNAPVSSLYLFGEKQDFAFQQEVGGTTKKRHHIRFWKCPDDWLLPGGFNADYLAAATYDEAVGFSLYTLQVTHRIQEDTDIERDYVIQTLQSSNKQVKVRTVENFSTGYHCRNGGGDTISTDGNLPFVEISKA